MRFPLALVMLLVSVQHGLAGAWPRGEGAAFLSLSHKMSRALPLTPAERADGVTSLYGEYGLTPKLTFGLDAGAGTSGGARSARVFLRRSIDPEGPHVFAGHAGVGLYRPDTEAPAEPLLRLGASWGRGLEAFGRSGWMGAEAVTEYRTGSAEALAKLDTTFGLNLSDTRLAILKFQAGDYPGSDTYLRVVPSIVQRFGPHVQVEIALSAEVIGERRVGVELATWFTR